MKVRFKNIDYHDDVIVLDCHGTETLFLPIENVDKIELKASDKEATKPEYRRNMNKIEDHLYYVKTEGSLVKEIEEI